MDNVEQERSVVMAGLAKALNAGGSAVVSAYDMTAGALNATLNAVKKAPVLPKKVLGVFSKGFDFGKPSEIKKAEAKISEYELKIKNLYYQIGKEGALYADEKAPLDAEPVKKLIADVRKFETEIQLLGSRIAEIKEQKKAEALNKQKLRKEPTVTHKRDKATEAKAAKSLEAVIATTLKQGEFGSLSEREIFQKARIPCGTVNTIDALPDDPQVKAREMIVHADHPGLGKISLPGIPIKLSATPGNPHGLAPSIGEHNEEVYSELLGLGAEELDQLREEDII